MHELKTCRGIICHDNKEQSKISEGLICHFKTNMRNLTNFDPRTKKFKKLAF